MEDVITDLTALPTVRKIAVTAYKLYLTLQTQVVLVDSALVDV